jgi:3'-phosphoadenosine 5'-phosphosulfate (PAPS) 3'-phosphatase
VYSQSDATQKLQERVTQLESEVSELSALVKQLQPSSPVPAADRQSAVVHESVQSQAPAQPVTTAEDEKTLDFFHGTTINVGLDTYYAYNFNPN